MELAITVIIHSLKHSSRLQLLLLYGVQDYGVSISVVSTNLAFFSLVVGEPRPLRVQPQAQEDGSMYLYMYMPPSSFCCFFLHISLMNAYSANFYVLIKKMK